MKNQKKTQLVIIAAMETEQRAITTANFFLAPTVKKPKMLKFQGQELLSITKYFAILGFTKTGVVQFLNPCDFFFFFC